MSLRMRDIVERTGITEATLRAWESRYGFPEPQRLPSGHRRYDERDVDIVRLALRLRDEGLPVQAALERARDSVDSAPASVFAGLRRLRPELRVSVLPKRSLVMMSHAIEDECSWGASGLVLFGAFQRERHYRASEARWRDLARAADAAFVFADFAAPRRPRGGPVEVPIDRGDPLSSEWVVICDGSDRVGCMVGWEPPGQDGTQDSTRVFETLWTADRETARCAARICCELALDGAQDLVRPVIERLSQPVARSEDELRRAEALTSRMIAYLAASR